MIKPTHLPADLSIEEDPEALFSVPELGRDFNVVWEGEDELQMVRKYKFEDVMEGEVAYRVIIIVIIQGLSLSLSCCSGILL